MPPFRPASETVIALRAGRSDSSGWPTAPGFPSSSIYASHSVRRLLPVMGRSAFAGVRHSLLPLLDQLADLVSALAADLLVERGAALGLDGLAALLPDLLVEARAALGLHRLAALAADLLVELPPARLADADAALAAGLRDRHCALAAALLFFRL